MSTAYHEHDGHGAAPPSRPTVAGISWFSVDAALVVAATAVVLLCYWDTLLALISRWNSDPNYSHGYLVPFVSGYLAWQSRGAWLLRTSRSASIVAVSFLLAALLLRYATLLVASLVAECFSLLLVLSAAALWIGGWPLFRRLAAPIGFLVFMVPWPSAVYSRIAFPLQLFVSQVASVVLQMSGIPVLRDGNLLHLPSQTMHVAEACSGLRQLTAFLAICCCAALMMPRPWWYRAILLASSIPIAVLINILRVTATGLLLHHTDPAWTEGWLHTAEGMIMVVLGLGLLLAEVAVLDWIIEREPVSSSPAAVAA